MSAIITAPLALVATAMLITPPTAHADQQAFLNQRQSQGVFMVPGAELEAGHHACADMRAGAGPDAASHYGYRLNQANGTSRRIVDAVQTPPLPRHASLTNTKVPGLPRSS
jgi:Protein of unknown function (DUF732)